MKKVLYRLIRLASMAVIVLLSSFLIIFLYLIVATLALGAMDYVSVNHQIIRHGVKPTPDPTETVATVHVSMQPGQSWSKEWNVSELPDSVDVIRVVVTAQECRAVKSL